MKEVDRIFQQQMTVREYIEHSKSYETAFALELYRELINKIHVNKLVDVKGLKLFLRMITDEELEHPYLIKAEVRASTLFENHNQEMCDFFDKDELSLYDLKREVIESAEQYYLFDEHLGLSIDKGTVASIVCNRYAILKTLDLLAYIIGKGEPVTYLTMSQLCKDEHLVSIKLLKAYSKAVGGWSIPAHLYLLDFKDSGCVAQRPLDKKESLIKFAFANRDEIIKANKAMIKFGMENFIPPETIDRFRSASEGDNVVDIAIDALNMLSISLDHINKKVNAK